MFKLDEKKVIFINVWSIGSEAQEVLGASKQSHKWQGTLPLNSHRQVYSGYYFISIASVLIIINTGQGIPVESPGGRSVFLGFRDEGLFWREGWRGPVIGTRDENSYQWETTANAC